jgi:pimeloyl-ACP methyl ester carboxylesterase
MKAVYDILTKDGYNVTIAQPPETSLDDDIAATNRVLDAQDGPTVLVGHSYGGVIITGAGNNPHVKSLVYVAAFEPDTGESLLSLANSKPPAGAPPKPSADGFLYIDQAAFHADFAADLPEAETPLHGPIASRPFDEIRDGRRHIACLEDQPQLRRGRHEGPLDQSGPRTFHVQAVPCRGDRAAFQPRGLHVPPAGGRRAH